MAAEKKTQNAKQVPLGIGFNAINDLRVYAEAGQDENFNRLAVSILRLYLGIIDGKDIPEGVDATSWSRVRAEFKVLDDARKRSRDNGSHGGRPRKDRTNKNPDETQRKPTDNPDGTQRKPTDNPDGTQTEPGPAREKDLGLMKGSLPSLSSDEPTLQDLEDAFNDLWDAYPRKSGKGDAKRAFFRVVREEGVAPATIFYAVMEQSKSPEWTEDGGKFVPALAKWLDGGRWEDVLSAPSQKNSGAPPAQAVAPLPYDSPEEAAAAFRARMAAEEAAAKEA